MHCWKLETERLVRSPPAWSIPHSTMNLRPFDVTTVSLEAGQERLDAPPEAVGAPLEVLEAVEVLDELLPVG